MRVTPIIVLVLVTASLVGLYLDLYVDWTAEAMLVYWIAYLIVTVVGLGHLAAELLMHYGSTPMHSNEHDTGDALQRRYRE